ncbi:MAG: hypothetical protein Fur0012_13930 [Elusimicrobiota bacterium]
MQKPAKIRSEEKKAFLMGNLRKDHSMEKGIRRRPTGLTKAQAPAAAPEKKELYLF